MFLVLIVNSFAKFSVTGGTNTNK